MQACSAITSAALEAFINQVVREGTKQYRDFAWRNTRDPYAILLSEIMLQQTQVTRVVSYYDSWLQRFPNIDALAAADMSEVLTAWQGLGYNRRALALKRLAEEVSENRAGILPANYKELQTLPGVGPATAAGVMAFAHNSFAPYLETNVRSVILHELFADRFEVCDKEVMAIVEQSAKFLNSGAFCESNKGRVGAHDRNGKVSTIDARTWNYALLDYGAWLKKAFPNPSRRSKQHTRQSRFEGSFRQKRARLLREVLAHPQQTAIVLADNCGVKLEEAEKALGTLLKEGFIQCDNDSYSIAD